MRFDILFQANKKIKAAIFFDFSRRKFEQAHNFKATAAAKNCKYLPWDGSSSGHFIHSSALCTEFPMKFTFRYLFSEIGPETTKTSAPLFKKLLQLPVPFFPKGLLNISNWV